MGTRLGFAPFTSNWSWGKIVLQKKAEVHINTPYLLRVKLLLVMPLVYVLKNCSGYNRTWLHVQHSSEKL